MNISHAFDETGERARLRELLLQRLTECGWVTLVEEKCREYIRAKEVENVTLDEVVNEVKKDARKAVPEEVKREIMNLIRDFVARMLAERERHGVPKEGGVQIEEIFDQPGPSTSRDA
ncbi:hypothetical protein L596_005052 [Steinernema carpocapsae]|uniref:Transcription and mRNA export factor ENY2 n=1 Tax=Steinernema carpocapsae TaxID=34508 RepID=A0A4U8UY02_STECR|nr:hypothetical protein L596_005052 [Steinernema carpocapsae]